MDADFNDELLKDANQEEKKETKKNSRKGGTSAYDLAQAKNIEKVSVKTLTFKDDGRRSFTISHSRDVSKGNKDKYIYFAKCLFGLGFYFRSTGDDHSEIEKEIVNLPEAKNKVHVYKLWSKREPSSKVGEVVVDGTSAMAFQVSANYDRNFLSRTSWFRQLVARNTEMILGPNCSSPVDLILTDTKCGSSYVGKGFNFDGVGDIPMALNICHDANIVVFNLGSDQSVKAFVEYAKAIKATTDGTTPEQPKEIKTETVTEPTPVQEVKEESKVESTEDFDIEEPVELPKVNEEKVTDNAVQDFDLMDFI